MAKKVVPVVKFPEVGTFTDPKALKKHYKGLTDGELCEWIELEGLEFKPNDHESINRMRMCMAVLYHHFPADAPKPKEKSKYADYTDLALIEMAVEHDVPVLVTDDAKIMRMRVIMALKAHKLLA
jgi:predicted nucleic acid-binding protein